MKNMNKLMVVLLLSNVSGYFFGMEPSLDSDIVSARCIILYNRLEEQEMTSVGGLSGQDHERLNRAKNLLAQIGLGYFELLTEMEKSYRKPEGGWFKNDNPKVKKCLLDSGSYLDIVPFTLDDLSFESSDEESCEYTQQDKELMKTLMFKNFSHK